MADSERPLYKILSTKTLWLAAALIALVAAVSTTWLLLTSANKLEAIRTANTLVLTTGGAAALLLAARRQRSTEITLNQKDRDLHHQERDAIERRITDLYTKAADQLGSDKAPVRLAGLYALERVAQDNPTQRQTIVNVLCAYLRMPFQPPDDEADPDHRDRLQEREVRLTTQRLLADHLRPDDAPRFWGNITLDLTGATLVDFRLSRCTVGSATFRSTIFTGDTRFVGTIFSGYASYDRAQFKDHASFESATFTGATSFDAASFVGDVDFSFAHFIGTARLAAVTFGGEVNFSEAVLERFANFGATFTAEGSAADFKGNAYFEATVFKGTAHFDTVSFRHGVSFEEATFSQFANFGSVCFSDKAFFARVTFKDAANFGRAKPGLEPTTFGGPVDFKSARFAQAVPTAVRKYWSPPEQRE
jgi:uncharacterized protein YjbI with pentapeptide repeats